MFLLAAILAASLLLAMAKKCVHVPSFGTPGAKPERWLGM